MLPPLVLVEGFCSVNSSLIWGQFESFLHPITPDNVARSIGSSPHSHRQVIFANVGPVSSLHDRACELYYVLKGGRVDYGDVHSFQARHSRYGRFHEEGLYPEWSSEHPIHFMGHSLGGPTIVYMAWLIKTGHFGESDHPDMILSITSVASPFRGTPLVYILGEEYHSAPEVRTLSIGNLLASTIHVLSYLSPLTRYLPSSLLPLDFHSESRHLGFDEASFMSLLRNLVASSWGATRDCAPWDATFASSDEREAMGWNATNGRTWYRSYVSCMTEVDYPGWSHRPTSRTSVLSPLYISSAMIGRFDYGAIRPLPAILEKRTKLHPSNMHLGERMQKYHDEENSEDWVHPLKNRTLSPNHIDLEKQIENNAVLGEEYWANDGVVPVFSQWHPGDCNPNTCIHHDIRPKNLASEGSSEKRLYPEPGIWHVFGIEEPSNHMSIIPLWMGTEKQMKFWRGVGKWLDNVDVASGRMAKPECFQNVLGLETVDGSPSSILSLFSF